MQMDVSTLPKWETISLWIAIFAFWFGYLRLVDTDRYYRWISELVYILFVPIYFAVDAYWINDPFMAQVDSNIRIFIGALLLGVYLHNHFKYEEDWELKYLSPMLFGPQEFKYNFNGKWAEMGDYQDRVVFKLGGVKTDMASYEGNDGVLIVPKSHCEYLPGSADVRFKTQIMKYNKLGDMLADWPDDELHKWVASHRRELPEENIFIGIDPVDAVRTVYKIKKWDEKKKVEYEEEITTARRIYIELVQEKRHSKFLADELEKTRMIAGVDASSLPRTPYGDVSSSSEYEEV